MSRSRADAGGAGLRTAAAAWRLVFALGCGGCDADDARRLGESAPLQCEPAASAVEAEPGTLVAEPWAPLPQSFASVGLYPDAPNLSVVAENAIHYEPTWPLWSNGTDKHRYLVLPPDGWVDTEDPDAWRFPVGTLFFKTFLQPDDADACGRPIETRVMRALEDGTWEYGAYVWDADGEQATLLDLDAPVPIDVGPFTHTVPARIECRACHESARNEILGFERLQLSGRQASGEADPLATLHASGVLTRDNEADRISHPDEPTRQVLGFLHGNCVHCHNGSGGPSSSFDLRHDVALQNTVGIPTQSSASAPGVRIVPGAPEESILFLAVSGETDDSEVSAMPPMGVDVRDAESIELLRVFISGLR